jgi:hypothetical protein
MNWDETYNDMVDKGIIKNDKQGDHFVQSYRDSLEIRERYCKFADLFTHGALYGLANMAFDDEDGESFLHLGFDWLIICKNPNEIVAEAVKVAMFERYSGNQCHMYRPLMPCAN